MKIVRAIELMVLGLVITWIFHFRGGVSLSSHNLPDKTLLFNVHPVLMVLGFLVLNGEAMLAYKTVSGTKGFKKAVHLVMQAIALCLSLIGVWAAFNFHTVKGVDHFYTLHSWLGLCCLILFGVQWTFGFSMFWYPGGSVNNRATFLPWHVIFGIYIYALAIVTSVTGFLEKATFLQTHHIISHYSSEAVLVNSLGMLSVLLAGFVIRAVISTPTSGKVDGYKPLDYELQHSSV